MPRKRTLTGRLERERRKLKRRQMKNKQQELSYQDDLRCHEFATDFATNSEENSALNHCNVRGFGLRVIADGSCEMIPPKGAIQKNIDFVDMSVKQEEYSATDPEHPEGNVQVTFEPIQRQHQTDSEQLNVKVKTEPVETDQTIETTVKSAYMLNDRNKFGELCSEMETDNLNIDFCGIQQECVDIKEEIVEANDDTNIGMALNDKGNPNTNTFNLQVFTQPDQLESSLGPHLAKDGETPQTTASDTRESSLNDDTEHRLEKETQAIEKTFACLYCGLRFTQKSHLSIHKMKHMGVDLFHCPQCSFKSVSFKNHLKIHTGEKSYSWDYCDYMKPHTCSFCDYKSIKKNDLNVHRETYMMKRLLYYHKRLVF